MQPRGGRRRADLHAHRLRVERRPAELDRGYTRLIGLAASTGAHTHVRHFDSTSLQDVERAAGLVRRAQGLKVTVEASPDGTGSTVVGPTFFADPAFPEPTGGGYDTIERLSSGRRFTDREDLLSAQAEDAGARVLWHFLDVAANDRHRAILDVSVLFPGGAIASDAVPRLLPDGTTYAGDAWPLPEDAVSHPRSSGTFARLLRECILEPATGRCSITRPPSATTRRGSRH